MNYFVLLWRQASKLKGLIFVIFCLFIINVTLLLVENKHLKASCPQDNNRKQTFERKHVITKSRVIKDLQIENGRPVLQWSSSKNDAAEEQPYLPRIKQLESIKNQTNVEDIRRVLQPNYNPRVSKRELTYIKDICDKEIILNCADIDYLEKRDTSPKLTYSVVETSNKKGELHTFGGGMTDIVMKSYDSDEGLQFNEDMENFLKLLKMQKWPGIPRVYAVCLTSADNTDLMLYSNTNKPPYYLRYMIDRYDDAFPLCDTLYPTDKCLYLKEMTQRVKHAPHGGIEALKIMRGFAQTFQAFELNGVFPYKFFFKDVVITKLYEVVFTEVNSFIFLETSSNEQDGGYTRVFSNVICKQWFNCPTINGRHPEILNRIGKEQCKEIRGKCGDNNRCWGLDAKTYLCVFSRWIFSHLHSLIPSTSEYYEEISNLLVKSSETKPEERYDWTEFYNKINQFLEIAVDK